MEEIKWPNGNEGFWGYQQNFFSKNQMNKNKKILVMGLTFKENCPDTRNSKVLVI